MTLLAEARLRRCTNRLPTSTTYRPASTEPVWSHEFPLIPRAREQYDVGAPPIFWYQGQAWYRHEVGGQVLYVSPTRIYMPEDGRFLERDLIERVGGMSYRMPGTPRIVDPTGLLFAEIALGALGAFIIDAAIHLYMIALPHRQIHQTGTLSGMAQIVDIPNFIQTALTPGAKTEALSFASRLYMRAAGGGGDLVIGSDNYSQSLWGDPIRKITAEFAFRAAKRSLKHYACELIERAAAGTESGTFTVQDLRKVRQEGRYPARALTGQLGGEGAMGAGVIYEEVPGLGISIPMHGDTTGFLTPGARDLRFALNKVHFLFRYHRTGRQPQKCWYELNMFVKDTYDFKSGIAFSDRKHYPFYSIFDIEVHVGEQGRLFVNCCDRPEPKLSEKRLTPIADPASHPYRYFGGGGPKGLGRPCDRWEPHNF